MSEQRFLLTRRLKQAVDTFTDLQEAYEFVGMPDLAREARTIAEAYQSRINAINTLEKIQALQPPTKPEEKGEE
jgi:hypothetical protein